VIVIEPETSRSALGVDVVVGVTSMVSAMVGSFFKVALSAFHANASVILGEMKEDRKID
jgi:hypothetical protein